MEVFIMGCCETQRNNTCCSTNCGCEEPNFEAEKRKNNNRFYVFGFKYMYEMPGYGRQS